MELKFVSIRELNIRVKSVRGQVFVNTAKLDQNAANAKEVDIVNMIQLKDRVKHVKDPPYAFIISIDITARNVVVKEFVLMEHLNQDV